MSNNLGLKNILPGFWGRGTQLPDYQVTPDEIDAYQQYVVLFPSRDYNDLGTFAGGTNAQAKALVVLQKRLDYPRNVSVNVTATANAGGTADVNGYDQFGKSITESIGFGTAAAGTPGGKNEGTKIFSQVTSGTFTYVVTGNGSASLGYGTSEGSVKFGLPMKIGNLADVKNINWLKEFAWTTFNGGTYTSTHVDTTNHAVIATAALGGTEAFVVTVKSSYDASGDTSRQAGL